jgi:hypothetical protein
MNSKTTQKLIEQLEDIKIRLIALETSLLKHEKASKEDIKRAKEALKEYRKGKTIPLRKLYP